MTIFYDVEEAIIDRLKEKLATLEKPPKVYPGADLADAENRSQAASAVFVAYNGMANVDHLPNAPHVANLTNEFIIWIVTYSASRHDSKQGIREKVDPVTEGILQALLGWRPGTGLPRLQIAPAPGPAYSESGFGYFPLVFHMRREVRGDIN